MRAVMLGDATEQPRLEIPFFIESVRAGFPSPAQDYIERTLDLNELCIKHPSATFFVRAEGDSMIQAGIFTGDVLVVDRSLQPRDRDIVIASVGGEFTVKRLGLLPFPALHAENPDYEPIKIDTEDGVEVFGVVTNVIHPLRR